MYSKISNELPILKSMYPSPPDTISMESLESGVLADPEGVAAVAIDRPP
jgi:hypothetical protein